MCHHHGTPLLPTNIHLLSGWEVLFPFFYIYVSSEGLCKVTFLYCFSLHLMGREGKLLVTFDFLKPALFFFINSVLMKLPAAFICFWPLCKIVAVNTRSSSTFRVMLKRIKR